MIIVVIVILVGIFTFIIIVKGFGFLGIPDAGFFTLEFILKARCAAVPGAYERTLSGCPHSFERLLANIGLRKQALLKQGAYSSGNGCSGNSCLGISQNQEAEYSIDPKQQG